MSKITPVVMRHVLHLFAPAEQFEALRLLRDDCILASPSGREAARALSERVQCAALKVSDGRIDRLNYAVALARFDWRDLLVEAGFANDPSAHLKWRR